MSEFIITNSGIELREETMREEPLEEPMEETQNDQDNDQDNDPMDEEKNIETYPSDPAYPISSRKILFDIQDQQYTFLCPHCNLIVAVEKNQVNCHIFRHGNFIIRRDELGRPVMYGDSIPPHSSKQICDELVYRKLIIGCGKPIQMYKNSDGDYFVRICEYI